MSNRTPDEIVEELLEKRGVAHEEREAFVQPDFTRDTHPASLLPGIAAAVERVATAKEETIVIFGDYDADGIPATALLTRVLRRFGYTKVIPVIPKREQGYGLTMEIIPELLAHQPQVIITVDNGTIAKEEVAALSKVASVIIIDHHEPIEGKVAEAALGIINPKMENSDYPFTELCACALAWKFACALGEKLGQPVDALRWELDLVALSTVADLVPLRGENRVLTHYGLQVLRKSRNEGLKALALVAGVSLAEIGAGDIAFKLAPRINAASRMHAEEFEGSQLPLTLLLTDDPEEAQRCAEELQRLNAARQKLVEGHIEEADRQVAAQITKGALVVYHDTWSTGIIGLVASRLLEKYRRPVIALAPEGGSVKGSVRTVEGVDTVELLSACSDLLERFGGHARAGGLTLKSEPDEFRDQVHAYMDSLEISLEELVVNSTKQPDLVLSPEELSLECAEAIEQLEPFGMGFPTPLLQVEATVRGVRRIGKEEKHMSCLLVSGAVQRKAVAFDFQQNLPGDGDLVTVTGQLGIDEWRDVRSPVLYIRSLERISASE